VRHQLAKLTQAILLTCAALASPLPVHAFDVGILLDRMAMERLGIAADETPIAIGGTDTTSPYVAVVLGNTTFFLDHYAPDNRRISRSRPLPTQLCQTDANGPQRDFLRMAITETTAGVAVFTNACPTGETIFLQDRDGNITSFTKPPIEAANAPLEVTIWVSAKPQTIDANVIAFIGTLTEASTGRRYNSEGLTLRKTDARRYDASTFAALVNQRLAQTRNNLAHLNNVRAALKGLDWRTIGDSRTLNNAAFHLSQSNDCFDLETATRMMNHVVTTTPTRHVAQLNLADTYAKAHSQKCNNLGASLGQSQEAFRLYCSGIGPARVSGAIRARYRAAMVVPKTENGSICQPQFGMQRALLAGDRAALERILADPENDIDVTFPDGNRALGLALERKEGQMARMILAAGGDPDRSSFYAESDRKYEFTPLLRAVWNYDVETVTALVGKGQSSLDFTLNGSPYRPFLKALEMRPRSADQEAQKLAILDLLLTLQPSPLQYDDGGQNAFYAAAEGYSSQAVFDRVAALGAFVNHPSPYGQTALFAIGPFAGQQATRTQSILLRLGANPNQQNQTGATPLLHAFAWTGADQSTVAAMVATLLDNGADPNIADQDGRTPLSLAAVRAMPDTVDLLIAKGAKLPVTKQYQTDPIVWITTRITEIEADPSRQRDCNCLADYKRILRALTKVTPPIP
jgi:ankyrin repeat protein